MNSALQFEIFCIVKEIINIISSELNTELMHSLEKDLYVFHFGLGTWLRNYILTENIYIYKEFLSNGIIHKDDMSAVIIQELHQHLKDKNDK